MQDENSISRLPEIVQKYLGAYNSADVATLIDCVTEAVVFENHSSSGGSLKVEGREAFGELAQQAATLFTARRQSVRTAVINGSTVALEVDWTGTPAVDIGTMKAGTTVALRGASFLMISGGKLARITDIG